MSLLDSGLRISCAVGCVSTLSTVLEVEPTETPFTRVDIRTETYVNQIVRDVTATATSPLNANTAARSPCLSVCVAWRPSRERLCCAIDSAGNSAVVLPTDVCSVELLDSPLYVIPTGPQPPGCRRWTAQSHPSPVVGPCARRRAPSARVPPTLPRGVPCDVQPNPWPTCSHGMHPGAPFLAGTSPLAARAERTCRVPTAPCPTRGPHPSTGTAPCVSPPP